MEFIPATVENTSGQGVASVVPPEIRSWNWGAFLMNWIWSIGMHTWIGLFAVVPYVGWIMAIILGVKGNEWAWQNRKWESVDQFKRVQRTWAYVALWIIVLIFGIAFLTAVLFPILVRARHAARGY